MFYDDLFEEFPVSFESHLATLCFSLGFNSPVVLTLKYMVWCLWYRRTIFLVWNLSLYFSNRQRYRTGNKMSKIGSALATVVDERVRVPPPPKVKYLPHSWNGTLKLQGPPFANHCFIRICHSKFSLRVCLSSCWDQEGWLRWPREPACLKREEEVGESGANPSQSQQPLQPSPFTPRRCAWPKRWIVEVPGQGLAVSPYLFRKVDQAV